MSKLLLPNRHLFYSPELAAIIGRNEAICLQQIHYWMGVKGGKVVDGIKWFWKTYEQWAQELQLSVSTVRRVIANLKELNLIIVDRLSAKTYYQANWYTLNHEALNALFQNEHIEAPTLDTSNCSEKADDNKESSSREVTLQEHSAANDEKVEQENNQEVKQPEVPHSAEDNNQDSANKQNHHEGNYSGADDETEVEKITNQELSEIIGQLRNIPCTPVFKINPQVQATIKKHPHNVPGAIAYLKEALRTWTRVDCPEAVFSKACKEGLKPSNWGKPVVEHPQPSDEQMAELKRALSRREIRDLSKAPDGLWFVDSGASILSWWEYLQVEVSVSVGAT